MNDSESGFAGVRESLVDPGHCPSCGAPLTSSRCSACGVDLGSPDGMRLWQLSQQVAVLLGERDQLLTRLRLTARLTARSGAAVPATVPAHPAGPRPQPPGANPPPSSGVGPDAPPIPLPAYPAMGPRAAAPSSVTGPGGPSLFARIGVQGLLVGLGALLVAIAGIVFLVFTWDRLSLGGRAAVVGVLTLAAMAGATWLRPRLPETAEGIGAIAVALVLADAWAIRATGLLGTADWAWAGYWALATTMCVAVLLGWARFSAVRVASMIGSLLIPLPAVLAGAWVSGRTGTDSYQVWGLLAAAALTVIALIMPPTWRFERRLLAVLGAVGWLGVLPGIAWLALSESAWMGTAVALVLTGVAAMHAWAAPRLVGRDAAGAWSAAFGGSAALVPPVALSIANESSRISGALLYALIPVTAALVALAVRPTCGPGRTVGFVSHRWSLRGARGVTLLAALPALVVSAVTPLTVSGALDEIWRAEPGTPLSDTSLDLLVSLGDEHLYLVASLVLTGVLLLAARPVRWTAPAATMIAAGLLLGPLSPALPIWATLALSIALAAGAGWTARRVGLRRPDWLAPGPWRAELVATASIVVAVVAVLVAVALAWTVREFSVPVTVAAALALPALPAVLPAGWWSVRPVLTATAVGAISLSVGFVPAVARSAFGRADALTLVDPRVMGLTAAVIGVVLVGLPAPETWRRITLDRAAGAAVAFVLAAFPVLRVITGSATSWTAATAVMVCAALLLLAAVAAAHPSSPSSPAGSMMPLAGAGLIPAAVLATAVAAVMVNPATEWNDVRIIAAAAVAIVALIVAALSALVGRSGVVDRRVPAAELGTGALLALLALPALAIPALEGPVDDRAWVVPLLLGVGVTALAMSPGRRRLAWAGWVLLAASNAFRLISSGVEVVEAYTLPPALALLAVSALRLRLDRRDAARSTVVPGLSLVVLPSVLASADGAWQRPALLIALGALALAGRRWLDPRVRPAAFLAALAAAGGAGLARAIGASELIEPTWRQLEVWTLPAAVVVLAGGLLLLADRPGLRSRWPLAPGIALLLVPSLVAALDGEPVWRVALVAVLAAAVVLFGVWRRLQAPLLYGGGLLAVHAVVQLAPWVTRVIAGMPRWVPLVAVGLVLLALGATYEKRLRDLRAVRVRVGGLR